jgi:GT2 family glycosyltransferase
MIPAILALTCDRIDETARTWEANLRGRAVPVYWWDNSTDPEVQAALDALADRYEIRQRWRPGKNMGIAAPLNYMMRRAFDTRVDVVITMADDIIEEELWIFKLIEGLEKIPRAGIVASPPIMQHMKTARYMKNADSEVCYEEGDVIGNWAISKSTFEKVGELPEYYGIYGPIDLDYCARVRNAGLRTVYRSDMASNHIGHSSPLHDEKMKSLDASHVIYAQKMKEING